MLKIGKTILISGGARSGKSTLAEKIAKETGKQVTYVATSLPIDDEMKDRIRMHQKRRPSEWSLLESYSLEAVARIPEGDTLLLDCLTIMTVNLLYDELGDFERLDSMEASVLAEARESEKKIMVMFKDLMKIIKERSGDVILVTNEIGLGLVPETYSNRFFRDLLGRANQFFASNADEVLFCISGLNMKIK